LVSFRLAGFIGLICKVSWKLRNPASRQQVALPQIRVVDGCPKRFHGLLFLVQVVRHRLESAPPLNPKTNLPDASERQRLVIHVLPVQLIAVAGDCRGRAPITRCY
jgi:hypothetical protein